MPTASKLLRIICILLTLLSVLVCCTAGCTPKNPSAPETPDPENPPAPEDPDKEPDYEPGSYVQLIYMCGSSLETNGGNATVLFEGNWVSLGGHLLHCTILEQSNGVTLYEAPVTVDLFFATLIFSYDSRTNKTDIVGIMYEGDPGQIHELTPGTEIAVCKRKVLEDGSRRDIDSELFVYTENMAVEIGKVPDGFYQYNTYVKDIYDKQYCAGAALILMQDGNSILVATSPDDIFFRDIESSPEL